MSLSTPQILRRHDESLHGRLVAGRLRSKALRIAKPYFVYEPPGLTDLSDVPILYLLRGHQREWVNMREDGSRGRSTAIEDLDSHIASGAIDPVIAVMPGLNSANNHVPSLGINMAGTWGRTARGLGTGRFWDYLTEEVIPRIADSYARHTSGEHLAVGFSLGGYTASLLAAKLPHVFSHVGIYDGLLMWPGNADPRVDGDHNNTDPIWCKAGIFDAAFGQPRDARALAKWNPTDMILEASPQRLAQLRETRFYIASAPNDGRFGNVDRTRHFVSILREKGIPLTFDGVVLDEHAEHSWHWTDRFLISFLTRSQEESTLGTPAQRV